MAMRVVSTPDACSVALTSDDFSGGKSDPFSGSPSLPICMPCIFCEFAIVMPFSIFKSAAREDNSRNDKPTSHSGTGKISEIITSRSSSTGISKCNKAKSYSDNCMIFDIDSPPSNANDFCSMAAFSPSSTFSSSKVSNMLRKRKKHLSPVDGPINAQSIAFSSPSPNVSVTLWSDSSSSSNTNSAFTLSSTNSICTSPCSNSCSSDRFAC
mmetsp:Transcript_5873/g.8638  ORF Transcript_5873/g.8638 Transcript_5873/m.8638 type:complete len:211 (-) Transcript_5873:552-1184(-)